MNKQKFLAELSNILETNEPLSLNSNLAEMEEYDSLAVMSLVALIHMSFKKKIVGQELANVTTVSHLISLIGDDCFED